ncbi:MAG: CapA family protein [Clostridia bacterium]|nr:CapA family protein [Clostridia bacterium]
MKLVICGDMSITEGSYKSFDEIDPKTAFNDVLGVFAQGDRVIVNLECALTESENRIPKKGPNLKGPKNSADTLKAAGVTDCTLSNNHIYDFGREGLKDTLEQLDRVGLKYTGIGKNYEDSRKDHTIVIDGITVTIVNVCEHEYTYATDIREGARPFDEFETMDDIRRAKASADYVIVVYHGGKEYCRYPSPRLYKACHEMVKCGADVVLCQHSHIIGVYEKFEGAHILYGQGNFHFVKYMNKDFWQEGLIALLDITREGIDIEFTPVKAMEEGIRLANAEEKARIMSDLWERSESLRDGTWINGWREFVATVESNYKKHAGFTLESTSDEYQMFAHYLDCEAHTDIWRELFKTWNHTNELD